MTDKPIDGDDLTWDAVQPSLVVGIIGPVREGVETDVKVLQRLVKSNWNGYVRATERLKKARRQRDVLAAELKTWQERARVAEESLREVTALMNDARRKP